MFLHFKFLINFDVQLFSIIVPGGFERLYRGKRVPLWHFMDTFAVNVAVFLILQD
jgi:hypothetical protein